MKHGFGETHEPGSLSDLNAIQAAISSVSAESCVGVRLYNEEICLDPGAQQLATEIGKCVTCNTCQVKLERQAFTDELTGLGNRYALNRHLEKLLKEDAPILLVSTDLRKFKAVNENVDYEKGDEILVESAKKINEVVRDDDSVAKGRAGGDEMIIIMQLVHRIDEPGVDTVKIPVSPDEVPQIEAEIAQRIIRGHEDIQAFKDYNDEYGLTGKEALGVRVGTAVIYPKDLHDHGRTIQLKKFMKRADPKKHHFAWNDLV